MANMPKFELPKFDVPRFELPKFEMPVVDLPGGKQVRAMLRDTAYAGTGLVALTAERLIELQNRFVEVLKSQLPRAAR